MAVIKYAGAASGISWQMRKVFLNLNSQFDSNQPFNVPKPPPKKLVSTKSFKVPNISFLPAIPKVKFPLKMKFIPSIKKLKIGIITKIDNKIETMSIRFRPYNILFIK